MEPHELVKGEKAEKTEKSPTEVHEKAQAKPETVQTSVELLPKNGPEVGPGTYRAGHHATHHATNRFAAR